MRVAACILAFASSAFAYSVSVPNSSQGWTNQGGQPLVWQRVDTDRQNFTALLVNQQIQGFNPQILAALVDGTLGTTKLNPPSGGWPTGAGFRVNLVQDDTDLNTILAQSPTFNITQANVTTTASTTAATGISIVTTPTDTASGTTNTDPIIPPTQGSAAIAGIPINSALLGFISLLGFLLA
ncbi:GPI-anchored small secreted protein [Pholiota molesta]|nr:GPI-anchored small secreted protein [Pholiota molesta]